MNIQTFAAIDIGSFELTMKIYEFSGKNHMREVDYISRRLERIPIPGGKSAMTRWMNFAAP